MDVLPAIADERRRVADLVESLTPAQLETPSLCGEWTVRQVAGHLLAGIVRPRMPVLTLIARSGFRIHRANARLAALVAERPPAELARGLRDHAESTFRPPIVGYPGQLTDLQVHGQDMRRPLGLPSGLRPDRVRVSLDFLTGGRAVGFVPGRRLAALRFEAADLDWSWGAGSLVTGPAEALMLAMTGRGVALPELEGPGVPILRNRLA
ncbi:maleylpyruvate isomerase family mycothiol-dependent enzyme [Actinoplanes sp. NPDC026623]|uniref:maleylpyruvate isomerase family mycothiol-dependent enzyme n=1 Tax=Actinoplanes sp. NPDC026623 TaxID=3155610 RepID=UPI00340CBBB8